MKFLREYLSPKNWTWSHIIVSATFAVLFFLLTIEYFLLSQEQTFNAELRRDVERNQRHIEAIDKKLDILIERGVAQR